MRKVLERLKKAGLYLDIGKYEFNVTQVKYLGLIITTEGLKMDPAKIQTIVDWKTPRCVKDVQSFLGFANFYRRFVAGYSKIVAPMMTLTGATKTDFVFPWAENNMEHKSFVSLKTAFTTAPILAHFDPDKESWLETSASDYVIAAVLAQKDSEGIL